MRGHPRCITLCSSSPSFLIYSAPHNPACCPTTSVLLSSIRSSACGNTTTAQPLTSVLHQHLRVSESTATVNRTGRATSNFQVPLKYFQVSHPQPRLLYERVRLLGGFDGPLQLHDARQPAAFESSQSQLKILHIAWVGKSRNATI